MRKQNINISKSICFIQIFWLLITGLYVFHINKISTEWYVLKELQEEKEILLLKQEDLNLKISRAQSLSILKNDASIKTMLSYQTTPLYIKSNKEVALSK